MKFVLLISALVVATAVVAAAPVEDGDDVDGPTPADGFTEGDPGVVGEQTIVDVTDVVNDMMVLHEKAIDVIQQVETTLATLDALLPHSIRKRQVTGSVHDGPGGTTGTVSVKHKVKDYTIGGSISKGPGGSAWDAGISRTWNNGQTSFGATVGRGPGTGSFGGFSFSHKFGRKR